MDHDTEAQNESTANLYREKSKLMVAFNGDQERTINIWKKKIMLFSRQCCPSYSNKSQTYVSLFIGLI